MGRRLKVYWLTDCSRSPPRGLIRWKRSAVLEAIPAQDYHCRFKRCGPNAARHAHAADPAEHKESDRSSSSYPLSICLSLRGVRGQVSNHSDAEALQVGMWPLTPGLIVHLSHLWLSGPITVRSTVAVATRTEARVIMQPRAGEGDSEATRSQGQRSQLSCLGFRSEFGSLPSECVMMWHNSTAWIISCVCICIRSIYSVAEAKRVKRANPTHTINTQTHTLHTHIYI